MAWALECEAAVFRRRQFLAATEPLGLPRAMRTFRCVLPEWFEGDSVSRSLAVLVPDVEQWLVFVGADLVNDVVVTAYSIEAADGSSLDSASTIE